VVVTRIGVRLLVSHRADGCMFAVVGTVWGRLIGSWILIRLPKRLNAEAGSRFPGIQGVIFGSRSYLILVAPEGFVLETARFLRAVA